VDDAVKVMIERMGPREDYMLVGDPKIAALDDVHPYQPPATFWTCDRWGSTRVGGVEDPRCVCSMCSARRADKQRKKAPRGK